VNAEEAYAQQMRQERDAEVCEGFSVVQIRRFRGRIGDLTDGAQWLVGDTYGNRWRLSTCASSCGTLPEHFRLPIMRRKFR